MTSCDDYGLTQSTAPTLEPVDAAAVRAYGLVDDAIQDPEINALCKSARKLCETHTGRQFITASWQMTLDGFPSWEIQLRRPPWISITSVVYLDTAGASQTLSASLYRFETVRGRLTPAYGETWPSTYAVTNAVTITYTAGYGTTPGTVPEDARTAIKMIVLDYFENRRGQFRIGSGAKELLDDLWTGEL